MYFRQYEETLDSLQADIDALEQEKYELKERLKVLSKKTLLEGISRQASGTVKFLEVKYCSKEIEENKYFLCTVKLYLPCEL